MSKLNEAILFAAQMHSGQFRKGTTRPYIVHPMEVLNILIRMNAHEALLMAGVLHDVAEDTDATIEDIAARFGAETAALVDAHTEKDKTLPWLQRKQASVDRLRTAPRDVKLLVLADKLSNLRAMAHDQGQLGDKLWERFCADKTMQSRYYSASIDALDELRTDPDAAWAYWELNTLYKEVFVQFYIDARHIMLVQEACHGKVFYLPKNDAAWYELPGQFDLTPITRQEAEFIEDLWKYV